MAKRSLETAIRDLLEPEIAGGMSAFEDVEILLAAWKEMHEEREHWRALVEKVGVVSALRGLIAAAEPLCGKLEVVPGRAKLPPEYYPAASAPIQALRDAVAIAKAALNGEADGG